MLQWFLRFSEFPEFNESSAPFRENSNVPVQSRAIFSFDTGRFKNSTCAGFHNKTHNLHVYSCWQGIGGHQSKCIQLT